MKKFKIATLGCRTNQYESQAYRTQLEALGYKEVTETEEADLCIVNTCTVTASADSRSKYQIRKLAKDHPNAKVVVTGCFADGKKELVESIEGVDQVVRNAEKESLVEQLFPDLEVPSFLIDHFNSHTRAFVKVQDGCNSFCSYCIIPYVRGRSVSRSIESVVAEVEGLVGKGFKEVVITGINVGDFDGGITGKGAKPSLAALVRAVDAVKGLQRLRISSIDPDEVDEELADAVINGRTTCPSMHIVLQSGSNVVLKRMNRKYTRQEFYKTFDYLKGRNQNFTFTTDIIVGFPGETEEDFQDTIRVIDEVGFAKVHMFPYSNRDRTKAALFEDQLSSKVITERKQRLLRQAEQAAYKRRGEFVGQQMSILTEESDSARPSEIAGHTANFLKVWIPKGNLSKNKLVEIKLVENSPDGLIGSLV